MTVDDYLIKWAVLYGEAEVDFDDANHTDSKMLGALWPFSADVSEPSYVGFVEKDTHAYQLSDAGKKRLKELGHDLG